MNREIGIHIYTLPCVKEIDSQWEAATQHGELTELCDDLEGGWGGGVRGKSKREGTYVYLGLIHFVVQQKLIQHCKAIILQFKKKKHEDT